LLAFKSVLVEGSEVTILALATVRQLGKRNVIAGVGLGFAGSLVIFFVIREVLSLLTLIPGVPRGAQEAPVDLITGIIILYFSSRFLRGFAKYYFGKKSFRAKMENMSKEVIEEDLEKTGSKTAAGGLAFSFSNALPVISITLTEGFEASLVLGAAGSFGADASFYVLLGALVSILILIAVSAVSYDYLMRFPRWLLDLIAGVVLLSFGLYFLSSGIYSILVSI
jgi:uncharacterized membrane protein